MDYLVWAWNSPQLVLWIAPIMFAAAVLFDNDFIGLGIYRCRMDGVVISALYGGLLPLLVLAPFIELQQFHTMPTEVLLAAIVGALLYFAHLYFYFDVLFTLDTRGKPINDGSGVELFINLNVLFVPLCAWLVLGQDLTVTQWAGVFVIVIAALMLSGVRCARVTVRSGILTALMLAVYYLCEDYVYDFVSLKNGFFVFSLALTVLGFVLMALPASRPAASVFAKKNLFRFLLAEVTTIIGVVASQQALKLNPVVYVIAIESFAPVFVTMLSVVPTTYFVLMMKREGNDGKSLQDRLMIFSTQRENIVMKISSALVMVGGTVLLLS